MPREGIPLPHLLLFDLKMEQFGAVFQLNLMKENIVRTHKLSFLLLARYVPNAVKRSS